MSVTQSGGKHTHCCLHSRVYQNTRNTGFVSLTMSRHEISPVKPAYV